MRFQVGSGVWGWKKRASVPGWRASGGSLRDRPCRRGSRPGSPRQRSKGPAMRKGAYGPGEWEGVNVWFDQVVVGIRGNTSASRTEAVSVREALKITFW
jgi:hypothetical protein